MINFFKKNGKKMGHFSQSEDAQYVLHYILFVN